MKQLFIFFFLLLYQVSAGQGNTLCFVTSIKGSAFYHGKALKPGDTISYHRVSTHLELKKGSMVTFYTSKGTFRARTGEMASKKHGENLLHFAKEMLRINGRNVSLSSRGDCDCFSAEDCFATDPQINDKVLFTGTLSFPIPPDIRADSFFYFLQLTDTSGTYNNKLSIVEGQVQITENDLLFGNQPYAEQQGSVLKLGLFRYVKGEKRPALVGSLKLERLPAAAVRSYYDELKKNMTSANEDAILESLYTDLYVYYGKPHLCQLKKLIGSSH